MSEITIHLEKLCKELHDYVKENFQSDTHEVRIGEIKFETHAKPVAPVLDIPSFKPMVCKPNEQGQIVCTP